MRNVEATVLFRISKEIATICRGNISLAVNFLIINNDSKEIRIVFCGCSASTKKFCQPENKS
ncbi:MAG: hypothetical protein JWR16_3024 [Nevskia sp.]|nr:hypothetical protein [Nevskia sp.]